MTKKAGATGAKKSNGNGNGGGAAYPFDLDDAAEEFFAKPAEKISGFKVKVKHLAEDRSLVIYDCENPVDLIFGGDKDGGKRIAVLSDGTRVFPAKTTEFHPFLGTKYLCSVQFRQRKGGKVVGYARPVLPYSLTTEEFSTLSTQLIREVIFRQGDRSPVSNDKETGKIILPQSKGEDAWIPEVGKKHSCVVFETPTCFIAERLEAGGGSEKALVLRMAKKGNGDDAMERLEYMVWRGRYQEIYALLSRVFEKSGGKEGLVVDKKSTAEQIQKAFQASVKLFHPDNVFAGKNVSDKTRAAATGFFEAIKQSRDQAMELIPLRKEEKFNLPLAS